MTTQAPTVPGETDTGRRAAGNVVAVAASQLAGKVLTLAWTVVAARELSQHDFGAFNFVLSVALILSAFAESGFDPALVRMASRRPSDRDRHYTEAMLAESAVGLLLFGGALAVMLPTHASTHESLAVALILIAVYIDLWNDTARSVGAAAGRQGLTSLALFAQRIATAAFVLPLLATGHGLAGLAVGLLGGYIVGWIANVLALRSIGSRLRPGELTVAEVRSFVRTSLPIGVSSLILVVVARVDTVLLGLLRGNDAVAAYSTAYKLFETLLFVTFAVSSATFPIMSAAADDPERVRQVARTAVAVMTVVFVPFTAVFLVDATPILHLVFGGDYGRVSAGALRWLAPAPIAYALAFIGGTALIALGHNRALLVSSLSAAFVNVVGNLLVIPHWGGTGAALMTTTAYAVDAAVALTMLAAAIGPTRVLTVAPEALLIGAALGVALWLVPAPMLVEVPVGFVLYLLAWVLVARKRAPEQVHFLAGLIPGRAR